MTIDQKLELVYTNRHRYLGMVREDAGTLYLTQAAALPEDAQAESAIALFYYSERSRRNLREYTIPKTALEMRTFDPHIERMVQSYVELAKVANRGAYGKARAARLKKFLKKLGEGELT